MTPNANSVVLSTIRSPKKGVLREISHRSRIAVPAARKEVVKQFYPGDLITTNGDSSVSFEGERRLGNAKFIMGCSK